MQGKSRKRSRAFIEHVEFGKFHLHIADAGRQTEWWNYEKDGKRYFLVFRIVSLIGANWRSHVTCGERVDYNGIKSVRCFIMLTYVIATSFSSARWKASVPAANVPSLSHVSVIRFEIPSTIPEIQVS